LIYGLSQETTPDAFRRALFQGALEQKALADVLHRLPVQAGDTIVVPTGTVHALLEGIVVAEIQQNSDTTYRVYDWGRLGADGQPRPLHVDKALEVIDFGRVRPQASSPEIVGGRRGQVRYEIARCPYFVVEKVELEGGATYRGRCDGTTFEIWGSVSGAVQVRWTGDPVSLSAVRFALLPAALGEFTLQADQRATLLRAYAPE
jgi:mannose-6-phosphate isomerase